MLARLRAGVVSVVALGAVLSVLGFQDGERWFPLSQFPMFSVTRPGREPLPFVEVLYADGTRERVSAAVWSPGVVGVARNLLASLPKRSAAEREAFCTDLAEKVAARMPAGEHGAPTRVAVLTGLFRARDVLEGRRVEPKSAAPVVTCAVQ